MSLRIYLWIVSILSIGVWITPFVIEETQSQVLESFCLNVTMSEPVSDVKTYATQLGLKVDTPHSNELHVRTATPYGSNEECLIRSDRDQRVAIRLHQIYD